MGPHRSGALGPGGGGAERRAALVHGPCATRCRAAPALDRVPRCSPALRHPSAARRARHERVPAESRPTPIVMPPAPAPPNTFGNEAGPNLSEVRPKFADIGQKVSEIGPKDSEVGPRFWTIGPKFSTMTLARNFQKSVQFFENWPKFF